MTPIIGTQQTSIYIAGFTPSGTNQKLKYRHEGEVDERFIEFITKWANTPGDGRMTLVKKFVPKTEVQT